LSSSLDALPQGRRLMIRRPLQACWTLLFSVVLTACASSGVPSAVTEASISGVGPYTVMSYTDFPDVPEFGDGTIYYPSDASGTFGGVAVAPGFTEGQSHIEWWGPRLASHGYAVLVLDTNEPRERPDARADALMAAVRVLRAEGARSGGPLEGKVDRSKMAIMGHSMGGGGVLIAANRHSADLSAVIPFTPWEPEADLSGITVPTLVMAGSADRIAPVEEHAWRHFNLIPSGTTKVYMEVDGGNHYIADTERGPDLAMVGRYGIAWLKLYMDGDERYRDFIYGERTSDAGVFSRYVTAQ
jgi:dienelactone hydrolase